MSDKWEVKHSPWGALSALGEGLARAAGADPKPDYQGQDVKVRNRETGEEKTVHVGWFQELGDAIAKGQFKEDSSSSGSTEYSNSSSSGDSTEYSKQRPATGDYAEKAPLWMWILLGIVTSSFIAGGVIVSQNRRDAVPSYPLCADARDQKIMATTTIRVRADCWSGWVKLTPGTKFDLIFSDETELFYWGGERRKLPMSVGFLEHSPSTFRLRGRSGTVTINLEDRGPASTKSEAVPGLNIAGTWRGTYIDARGRQIGVSLSIEQSGSSISGTFEERAIVNDIPRDFTGTMSGTIEGRKLRFTKTYNEIEGVSVNHFGVFERGDDYVNGVWTNRTTTGRWSMRRDGG